MQATNLSFKPVLYLISEFVVQVSFIWLSQNTLESFLDLSLDITI